MYFGMIDYVHDLVDSGQTAKARAFWEYAYRIESGRPLDSFADSLGVSEEVGDMLISEFSEAISASINQSKSKLKSHTSALRGCICL